MNNLCYGFFRVGNVLDSVSDHSTELLPKAMMKLSTGDVQRHAARLGWSVNCQAMISIRTTSEDKNKRQTKTKQTKNPPGMKTKLAHMARSRMLRFNVWIKANKRTEKKCTDPVDRNGRKSIHTAEFFTLFLVLFFENRQFFYINFFILFFFFLRAAKRRPCMLPFCAQ